MGNRTDYNSAADEWRVPLSELVGKTVIKLEKEDTS